MHAVCLEPRKLIETQFCGAARYQEGTMRNPDELTRQARSDRASLQEELLRLRTQAAHNHEPARRALKPRGQWDDPIPLSFSQERLWFLDQLGLVGPAYNMPLALRLSGDL